MDDDYYLSDAQLSCLDVAAFFLAIDRNGWLFADRLKLFALIYIAQLAHLSVFRKVLVRERFQPGLLGPRISVLIDVLEQIEPSQKAVWSVQLNRQQIMGLLLGVYEAYASQSIYELIAFTRDHHTLGAPWAKATTARHVHISEFDMRLAANRSPELTQVYCIMMRFPTQHVLER